MDGATVGIVGGDQNMQQHDHAITDSGHTHNNYTPNASYVNDQAAIVVAVSATSNPNNHTSWSGGTVSATTGITVDNEGTGASQNVQPVAIVTKIIKT